MTERSSSSPRQGLRLQLPARAKSHQEPGAFVSCRSPPLLVNGRIAFTATLTGTGVTTSNNQAIFSGSPASISLIARKGDLVPTIGANISSINDFAISQDGAVAFRTILTGGGVTTGNDSCILHSSGGVTIVAGREGTLLPAVSATARIGDLSNGPLVAPLQGLAEAVAPLTGTGSGSTNTLFRYTLAGPQIIARAKAAAPGTAAGVTFLDIPQVTSANSLGTADSREFLRVRELTLAPTSEFGKARQAMWNWQFD